MTIQNSPRPLAKSAIQANARQDLRAVYLTVYNGGTVDVNDITDATNVNVRYARELLGRLEADGFIVRPDENEATWTYNVDLFQDRADNDVSAAEIIDTWLTDKLGPESTSKAATATSIEKTRSSSRPKAGSDRTCLCGCGRSTRGNFAPGHDAKMAGQVANEIVAYWVGVGQAEIGVSAKVDGFLSRLPSEPLRAKAYNQAQSLWDKTTNKHATKSQIESAIDAGENARLTQIAKEHGLDHFTYGRVKVGRKWFAARRDADNVVMRANTPVPSDMPWLPLEQEYTGSVEGKPASTFTALEVQP